MTPWTPEIDMTGVSVSDADKAAGSPKPGDWIARNPQNHDDKWLVAADFYAQNYAPAAQIKNPRVLRVVEPGATYYVPTYRVTDAGIEDGEGMYIGFCKGNKEDASALRQEGVFTETLIQVSKEYLETVNVGDLASRETALAITKLDEALFWIGKRAEDRRLRGVQAACQK